MNHFQFAFRKFVFVIASVLCFLAYTVLARATRASGGSLKKVYGASVTSPTAAVAESVSGTALTGNNQRFRNPFSPFLLVATALPPMLPRNGHTLRCAIVARISGCTDQKEESLEDQTANGKAIAESVYDGPIEYEIVATKGKGERLDRPELAVIEAAYRSGKFDLSVFDDIGRLVRGGGAVRLLGIAVDAGMRVICPNDCIDTAESTWEEDALAACRDHVSHNAQTSKRIKQKMMNRFSKYGATASREIAGYVVPEGAKTYEDWKKRDEDTPIIREGKELLRRTLNCSTVADLFNARGFPPGPYSRLKAWDGAVVRRYYSNPILKGMPYRGRKHTIKDYGSGRRISVKNPKGPNYYHAPHLAHLAPEEFDDLDAALAQKNENFCRRFQNGQDPLYRVARRRTRFPGQLARCFYCGRQYVWGGNGLTSDLMCSGPRTWECWNGVSFTGALAAERIVDRLMSELAALEGFDAQILDIFQRSSSREDDLQRRQFELRRWEAELATQQENARASMAKFGPIPLVEKMVLELGQAEQRLAIERWEVQQLAARVSDRPPTGSELRSLLQTSLGELSLDSTEFADLMRQLITRFDVYNVRLLDGGHLLPQARIRLQLDGILPMAGSIPEISTLLVRDFTIDLWEPTLRERILPRVVELSNVGLSSREIVAALPEDVTQPVVLQALALAQAAEAAGLEQPYEFVSEPPAGYKKLRRHKNARYRFSIEEGYEPEPL